MRLWSIERRLSDNSRQTESCASPWPSLHHQRNCGPERRWPKQVLLVEAQYHPERKSCPTHPLRLSIPVATTGSEHYWSNYSKSSRYPQPQCLWCCRWSWIPEFHPEIAVHQKNHRPANSRGQTVCSGWRRCNPTSRCRWLDEPERQPRRHTKRSSNHRRKAFHSARSEEHTSELQS